MKALFLICLIVLPIVFTQNYKVPDLEIDEAEPNCDNVNQLLATASADATRLSNYASITLPDRISKLKNIRATVVKTCGIIQSRKPSLLQLSSRLMKMRMMEIQNLKDANQDLLSLVSIDMKSKCQKSDDSCLMLTEIKSSLHALTTADEPSRLCEVVTDAIEALQDYLVWLGPAVQSYYIDGKLTDRISQLTSFSQKCISCDDNGKKDSVVEEEEAAYRHHEEEEARHHEEEEAAYRHHEEEEEAAHRHHEEEEAAYRHHEEEEAWIRYEEEEVAWHRHHEEEEAIWHHYEEEEATWHRYEEEEAEYHRHHEEEEAWHRYEEEEAAWHRHEEEELALHRHHEEEEAAYRHYEEEEAAWHHYEEEEAAWHHYEEEEAAWHLQQEEEEKARCDKYKLDGKQVSFKCLGSYISTKYIWLDSLTTTGKVQLASANTVSYSGTRWLTSLNPDCSYSFKSLGSVKNTNYQYLDGHTIDGTVGLSANTGTTYSGTHWKIDQLSDGSYSLKSLGTVVNSKYQYLDASTFDGSVALGSGTDYASHSGAHWQITIL